MHLTYETKQGEWYDSIKGQFTRDCNFLTIVQQWLDILSYYWKISIFCHAVFRFCHTYSCGTWYCLGKLGYYRVIHRIFGVLSVSWWWKIWNRNKWPSVGLVGLDQWRDTRKKTRRFWNSICWIYRMIHLRSICFWWIAPEKSLTVKFEQVTWINCAQWSSSGSCVR